jgi:hypothetical protein
MVPAKTHMLESILMKTPINMTGLQSLKSKEGCGTSQNKKINHTNARRKQGLADS